MSHTNLALARRYAKALFDLATEQGCIEKVEKDLGGILGFLSTSRDLKKVIGKPIASRQNQSEIMLKILNKAGANKITRNFIAVVAKNRRLDILGEIIESFNNKLKDARGEVVAEVTSSSPLSSAQTKDIEKKVGTALKKKVIVNSKVDAVILGGLKIKIGSVMLDNSLSGKIERMELLTKDAVNAS